MVSTIFRNKGVVLCTLTLLLLSCVKEDEPSCNDGIDDHFKVNSLINYTSILTKVDEENDSENYSKTAIINYEDVKEFRIIGQFGASNYSVIGPDCKFEHGALGNNEVTTRVSIKDVPTRRDYTFRCNISEVEIPENLEDRNDFTIFFSGVSETDIYKTSIKKLNDSYYRMQLPNYAIQFESGLNRGNYEFAINYRFSSIEYADTLKLEVK